ncbi:MAG: hypothetical protein HC884_08435 [Chloroflexaceae bacterium]|nr:hypothetical protein [Chloroflexaceae bacterium]
MEPAIRQQMMRTLEKLPDEAIEEMTTFVAYLQYQYVLKLPISASRSSEDVDPWEAFMQVFRQVQQGPWESAQTVGQILSAMRS